MSDVLLLTPREISTAGPSLNNQNVVVTDEEYNALGPVMRSFYEKVRENLGLACITASLRSAGYSVRSVNLHGRTPSDEAVVEFIRTERPKVVGISVMYDLHIIDAFRLVACVRSAAPDAFVMVGGAFCTYNAQLIATAIPEIDCVAFGEAEHTVVALMGHLAAGTDWRTVPGLVYRDGASTRQTGMPKLLNLADMAWPARDMLVERRRAGAATPVASTYTSRGCHAKCTFCYAPRQPGILDSGPWRTRPVLDVVDEIEWLQKTFGTRFVWFNDDNFGGAFGAGFEHAVGFAEEVIRRDLRFSFHCEFRVDSGLIDPAVLEVLQRAGLRSALLGMESGSPSVLRRFRKGTTVAYNFDAARVFASTGVKLDPGWIMIDPESTLPELWENLAFIVSTRVHVPGNPFFLLNRAVALRGTEMYERIAAPQPPPGDDPVANLLAAARRDYAVPDERIEILWSAWSSVGGRIADQQENDVPFVAEAIVRAVRGRPTRTRAQARSVLSRMRAWRGAHPDLLVAMLNYGLLAVEDPARQIDVTTMEAALTEMVAEFDTRHLGLPYDAFVADVERTCGAIWRPGVPVTAALS
jgi:radical SAM superfamily enzyme YgiQ (UPF0313 family)